MSDQISKISSAFLAFWDEAPQQAQAWGELVQKLSQALPAAIAAYDGS